MGVITKNPESYTCVVCGKVFVPTGSDVTCCSPFCRTMRITQSMSETQAEAELSRKTSLDAMSKPPRFNLKENPKARAEWFMSLPDEYRHKFYHFLAPYEIEYAKSIEHKRMAEDNFLNGFFVKKGKIVEIRGSSENEADNTPPSQDSINDDGDDGF